MMNLAQVKDNILLSTTEQLHLPSKTKMSKEQMILMRRTNAKQIQQITYEKEQEIEELKAQFQAEKKKLTEKYLTIIEEKDSYIKELEEICATASDRELKKQNEDQGNRKINANVQKVSLSKTLFLHQGPLYEDICYSIERPVLNKTQQLGEFLNGRSVKQRLLSGNKQRKCGISTGDNTKRSGSASRHKLVPAQQPSFKKIL